MDDMATQSPDLDGLRKWVHELNNHIAVVLGMSELLGSEQLSPRADMRRKTIEEHTLQIREIVQSISNQYLP